MGPCPGHGAGPPAVHQDVAHSGPHHSGGDNRFSVRLIDGKDNRKGGNRLDEMYTLNRVLDGDPFYVKITN
ncbi:hypothetical protein ACH437_20835 [Streptomyces xinghaiensis]|uniref:hypothetical protein n=1 Tax=Streptomyces xinghaiensis TaxID=1038928 RepID=UPI0037A331EC